MGKEAEDVVDDVIVRTTVLDRRRSWSIQNDSGHYCEILKEEAAAYMMIMRMTKLLKFMRVRAGTMVMSIATVVTMRMVKLSFELVVTMERSIAAVMVVVVFIIVRISSIIHQEPSILLMRATATRVVMTSLVAVPLDIHGLYFRILELANFDTVAFAVGACDWTG